MRAHFFCDAGRLLTRSALFALLATDLAFGQVEKRAVNPAIAANATGPAPARAQDVRITQGILSAKIERAAPDRAALTIATRPEMDANLKLFDGNGREVSAARSPDGVIRADVDPKRGYVLAPRSPERRSLPKDGLEFPARYVTFAPSGATNLGGLFLRPAAVPLTWDDRARIYATEIVVGYEFGDGAERDLAAPKTVTFFAEGANARIVADTVKIARSGVPGYQRVRLTTTQLEGETQFTARASPVDELKSSVAILREPGALGLSLPSTELAAFGVGSGMLTVTLLGRDGFPLAIASHQPLEVQLSSRTLRLPTALVLEPGKSSASVEVRTSSYGADRILAQSGGFRSELPVSIVFPTAAVVAALGGGALGGAARYLRNKRKRGPLLVRRIAEGVLVGIIIVGATWAGLVSVDVSTGVLGTPFGAFVLGALSGYLGCVVLDRVANQTFGGGAAK